MAYNTVTVTTSATQIVAANSGRKSLIIVNAAPATIVYIGPDSSITTSNSIPLYENQANSFIKYISENWSGPIYGIVSSGTADVRYWEVSQ